MKKIAIIGSGSWGCALGIYLAKNGNEVKIWSFNEEEKRMINENAALTQKCCGQEQLIKQYQNENTDYKNWVANLQNQVNDRLTELEEYKDWVHNLQAQIEERNKENREYKDWVNNLQVQIDSLKNGNN